ncbi:hypothetical protein [Streptomyces rubradiris]|uniref:Uncharacterized protein n=1 Tax=Streptomyces rubradiris TaxID=285531 RepID=A0ABQ3R4S8_STRRR|nr:hypothetical protein [Streptomyces rubradiris]GHH06470.1 hypothetical protein GCM10018792_26080 [Streptomyces rubradiris]GHI50856.1 hypothetical protein Srubr_07020 [Streptomyces rubradiris]
MSVDGPETPDVQEIPGPADDGSSQGSDQPGHTTMEDIIAADAFRSGAEGQEAIDGASDGPAEPVNGDRGTEKPRSEASGDNVPEEPGEPVDSRSPGHDETGHATAGDMDAVGDADDEAHDGDAESIPLKSEDPPSAPADDRAAMGVDLGDLESLGKRSAESNDAGEGSALTAETADDEELAAPEKGTEATRREGDGYVTDSPAIELHGSHGDIEESADRSELDEREPHDDSADVRGRDSAEDSRWDRSPTASEEPDALQDSGDPAVGEEPARVESIDPVDDRRHAAQNHGLIDEAGPVPVEDEAEVDGAGPGADAPERLHAFGNKEAPRPVRLDRDLEVEDADDIVGPFAPESPTDHVLGASTFIDPERAPATGQYHVLPQDAVLPPGLGLHADGEDMGGNAPWGHRTIYPAEQMSAGDFRDRVAALDWQWAGNKRKSKK